MLALQVVICLIDMATEPSLFSLGTNCSAGGKSRADPLQVLPHPSGAGEDADGAEPQESPSGAGESSQHQCQELRGGSSPGGRGCVPHLSDCQTGTQMLWSEAPGILLWPPNTSRLEKVACCGDVCRGGSLLCRLLNDPVVWADLPLTGLFPLCFRRIVMIWKKY